MKRLTLTLIWIILMVGDVYPSIIPIQPFIGQWSEGFEDPFENCLSKEILGGTATAKGFMSPQTQIVHEGQQSLGLSWALLPSITFNAPVYSFGGYWAEDTSSVAFIRFRIFGAGGLLGETLLEYSRTPEGNHNPIWGGWLSDTPISEITFDVGEHMVWADGLQSSSTKVPEAQTITMLLAGLGLITLGRVKGGTKKQIE